VTLRRFLSIAFLSVLMISACAPRPQDCARADVFCAGMVTDFGPISEGGNQEAWQGLSDAKSEGLVDRIDVIETIDVRDRAKNISTLAEDGYDVIVTVGTSISDETRAAAQQYPKILFIGVGQPQDQRLPNLSGLVFREDRGGFLSGALAALITQTNRVAAVCEEKYIDPMRRYCDGFQAGAKHINPAVHVTVAYRDGSQEKLFNDPDWGRAQALSAVSDGADVLFAAGGETADAALEAAAQQNAAVIGAETDPYLRLVEVRPMLVSSAVNDVRSGILESIRLTRKGQFPSGDFFGRTLLGPFHEWERQIPQSVKDSLMLIDSGLQDGSVLTGIPWTENESLNTIP
jgi:basic membrane protein A and related proteins